MPPLPFGEHALRSVTRRLHSTHPCGITKYDFRFAMINVVPFEMINDYLFEMSDNDLNRFEMIYDCHFEMTAKNFRQQNYFRQ